MSSCGPLPSRPSAATPVSAVDLPSELYPQVFEALSLGLVVFDHELRIRYRNRAADRWVAGHDGLVEALRAHAVDPRTIDWQTELRNLLAHRREARFDQVVYRRGQEPEQLLNFVCLPLDGPEPSAGAGVLVVEDVTAHAGLEKRLAVSERMAAVGRLAARVAHELNNPLDGILRYLNLAIRAVQSGQTERLSDYLLQARGGLLRMTEIIRELVEFSRSAHTAFDDAGINAAVEEAVKVMSDKAMTAGIAMVCRFEDELPATRGSSLFQVFCNLIKNALDAMPAGGTLTVVTRIADGAAVIRFEDTGVGLPESMERLFEPFFTTKAPGKGTGLGLAICKDIIEKHNGSITPAQRPGGGAVFTIRIPLDSCARVRRPLPADAAPVSDAAASDAAHNPAPRPAAQGDKPAQEESDR